MIADIAFHDLDSHNPHAHVMLTLRTVSPNGFGNKNKENGIIEKTLKPGELTGK